MVTECSKIKLNAQKFTLRFFPRTEPWIDDRHDIPDDILCQYFWHTMSESSDKSQINLKLWLLCDERGP